MGLRYYGTGASDAINALIDQCVTWNTNEPHAGGAGLWTNQFVDPQVPGVSECYIEGGIAFNGVKLLDGSYVHDGHNVGTGVPSNPPMKKYARVKDMWIYGTDPAGAGLSVWRYEKMDIENCIVMTPNDGMLLECNDGAGSGTTFSFKDNRWYGGRPNYRQLLPSLVKGWNAAKLGERFEYGELPSVPMTRFYPHPMDPKRLRTATINVPRGERFAVDLSEHFNAGDTLEIRNIEDWSGPPIETVTLGADRLVMAPANLGRTPPRMEGTTLPPAAEAMQPIGPLFAPIDWTKRN